MPKAACSFVVPDCFLYRRCGVHVQIKVYDMTIDVLQEQDQRLEASRNIDRWGSLNGVLGKD